MSKVILFSDDISDAYRWLVNHKVGNQAQYNLLVQGSTSNFSALAEEEYADATFIKVSLTALLQAESLEALFAEEGLLPADALSSLREQSALVLASKASQASAGKTTVVAITACPAGLAHTFLSAKALLKKGQELGYNIEVETHGQEGIGTPLSEKAIADAKVVILATDIEVPQDRFTHKVVYRTSTSQALKNTEGVFRDALDFASKGGSLGGQGGQASQGALPPGGQGSSSKAKGDLPLGGSGNEGSFYRHLMTGVSYMLPVTVAGGLLIALSFFFGVNAFKEAGTLPAYLMDLGGGAAFKIMLAIFSGYVAYSIADRPGLAVGLITGMAVTTMGAGFLGAIATGFLSGWVVNQLNRLIQLPPTFASLKPILILPFLGTLIVGLLAAYFIGPYVSKLNASVTTFLNGLQGSSAILIGVVLGAMMCVDMGGPINKAAYIVGTGLLASGVQGPMAAVMAGGMIPPLGMAIATYVARRKFNKELRESGNVALVLGLSFITEGAIPFVAADPIKAIAASVIGGAIGGGLTMLFGVQLPAPHGGIFVVLSVNHILAYLLAIFVGALVTGVLYGIMKKAN